MLGDSNPHSYPERAAAVRIRLLGPVGVTTAGADRPLSGVRCTAVLAVFGLQSGETMSTDRLVDLVWDGDPPVTAANTRQSHISHLRRLLGGRETIVARHPGYRLGLPQPATNAHPAARRPGGPEIRTSRPPRPIGCAAP